MYMLLTLYFIQQYYIVSTDLVLKLILESLLQFKMQMKTRTTDQISIFLLSAKLYGASSWKCMVLVQMRGLDYELNSFSKQQAVVKNGWMNGLIIVQIR